MIVTPSRVCELKSELCICQLRYGAASHPHGCVSWNGFEAEFFFSCFGHTLTGVWVEITRKHDAYLHFLQSHPHGCVSWNDKVNAVCIQWNGHTLTGVWVEISCSQGCFFGNNVTPSRVCELKSLRRSSVPLVCLVNPHGCVSWNLSIARFFHPSRITPSRVCELKF